MAFSETIKLEVKRKSHFTCCLCHSTGPVEVHHIDSQAEGGPDTLDNAAPLCPSCHETYGANPTKRKFIREARDHWYEICATRYAGDPTPLVEILDQLGKIATKDEIEHLVLRNLDRGSGDGCAVPWQHLKHSFVREEYVHPLIVQELIGWLSDVGQPIVAVDIGLANRSNRFHGAFRPRAS